MKKKCPLESASIGPRTPLVLLVFAAAWLIVTGRPPAFLRSEAPANVSQRTLSFAERVGYQYAIEDVYWRHRIWPKERPDPKPALDAMMSREQLEEKVTDYLRKSQALENYWQRPLTPEQLQAEMDRMATHTKQPEVLHELFAALGNDPFIVAECLARPALADRLATSWYAYDKRIHGELRHRAETDLLGYPTIGQLKQTLGTYSEMEFTRRNNTHEEWKRSAGRALELNDRQWNQTLEKLAGLFNDHAASRGVTTSKETKQLRTGVVSALQEDQTHFYATAIVNVTNDRLRLITVAWVKEPLQAWLSKVEGQLCNAVTVPGASYRLPEVLGGAMCIDDTWTPTAGAPSARIVHTAV